MSERRNFIKNFLLLAAGTGWVSRLNAGTVPEDLSDNFSVSINRTNP